MNSADNTLTRRTRVVQTFKSYPLQMCWSPPSITKSTEQCNWRKIEHKMWWRKETSCETD